MILELFRLDGKVALVTGASAGIGSAIAVALGEAGADVACHGNTRDPAHTCARIARMGRRTLALKGNLQDKSVPAQLVDNTIREFSRIDILVNAAGTVRRFPAADYPEKDWEALIEINLNSVFRLSRLVGRHMIEQKIRGKIVAVASVLAFQGGITVPAYAASKGGVAQLTRALANEWAAKGINVNCIAPGYMRTTLTVPLQQDETRNRQILERIPAGRWGEPTEIAGAAVFLCSAASEYVHGHALVVDGGWLGR